LVRVPSPTPTYLSFISDGRRHTLAASVKLCQTSLDLFSLLFHHPALNDRKRGSADLTYYLFLCQRWATTRSCSLCLAINISVFIFTSFYHPTLTATEKDDFLCFLFEKTKPRHRLTTHQIRKGQQLRKKGKPSSKMAAPQLPVQ